MVKKEKSGVVWTIIMLLILGVVLPQSHREHRGLPEQKRTFLNSCISEYPELVPPIAGYLHGKSFASCIPLATYYLLHTIYCFLSSVFVSFVFFVVNLLFSAFGAGKTPPKRVSSS